jgi:tetratricopeptide (TPR) repeat protein
MNKSELFRIIFDKKNYSLAEEVCKYNCNNDSLDTLAKVLFFDGKYERAEILFKKLHKYTEYGYCRLYQNDKEMADRIWFAQEDTSPLIMWAKALSGYIEKRRVKEPTFFQIRNFYETDLDTLLKLKMYGYAENLISSIQYFAETNMEVYKYTGRVLYNHGYLKDAEKFLATGKEVVWEDTELHFLDAEVKLAQNERLAAIKSLENALELTPTYYPAVKLLENIK